MDRLEHLGATLYTAPGLVPGILGAIIALLGVLLAIRSRAGLAAAPRQAPGDAEAGGARRVGVVLVLCLGYSVGLVGHIPFWLGTFLFVFLFIAFFESPMRRERGQVMRGIVMAIVYGAATSAIVSLVFERVFLVRLP
jgi:hypothetical protein